VGDIKNKNLKYKMFILFMVLIGFLVIRTVSINFYHSDEPEYDVNKLETLGNSYFNNSLNPIFIDGSATGVNANNWTWAINQPWCSGSGTWNDPYAIENVSIDGNWIPGSGGIEIKNSNKFFRIKNCSVDNSYDAGIRLNNVSNGLLLNNTIYRNYLSGLFLSDSNNNTILENKISDTMSGWGGIRLEDSKNNTISGNNLSNNENGAITLYSGSNNNTISENTIKKEGSIWNPYMGIRYPNYGIYLYYSEKNSIFNNNFTLSGLKIEGTVVQTTSHKIDTTNLVNGNPVYYYANEIGLGTDNFTSLGNAGQVILANCSDSDVSNLVLSFTTIGISLLYSNNNTISENTVSNNTQEGIYLYNSDYNTFSENTLNNNSRGLYLYSSDYNNISKNILKENEFGIYLSNCIYNILSENNMTQCGVYVDGTIVHYSSNTIDTTNLVNRKPVYYYVNETGLGTNNFTYAGNAGQIILASCDNSKISDLNPSHTSVGISLYQSYNNTISNNNVSNNADIGIKLANSYNNTISGNNVSLNNNYGIYLGNSNNNTILGNTVNDQGIYGIYLSVNSRGIHLSSSHNNTISGNTANKNPHAGISLVSSENNTVSGNIANSNRNGIILNVCTKTLVIGNWLSGNSYYGIIEYSCANNNIIWNVVDGIGDPFIIDDIGGGNFTWTQAANQLAWINGSGTYSDPYVIENLIIDANNFSSGIIIENSNVFFKIENCRVFNASVGINLINVNNSQLVKNNCSNNNLDGIRLYQSNNNTVSGNIVYDNNWNGINLIMSNQTEISGNTVYSNTQEGIMIYISKNNTISGNTVTNNDGNGVRIEQYSKNIEVLGNTLNNNYMDGIFVLASSSSILMRNIANNNNRYGIGLEDSDNNLVVGNILNGNAMAPYDDNSGSNNSFLWNLEDGYTDPIVFDDSGGGDFTWTQAINQIAWITGSGTSGDPYVIDNIIINSQNSGSCIEIGNSNAYLTIQNSEFTNSGSGSSDAGIKLDNANNIELYNDDSTFNNGYGIFLYYCQYIDISYCTVNNNSKDGIYLFESDNNDISNNVDTINSNNGHGIYLSLSDYNTISSNNIHYNDYGVYLLDSNYNSITSNEWSNNIGTVYESPGCIGNTFSDNDLPYPIVGDGGLDPMIIIIILISVAVIAAIVITGVIIRKKRSAIPRKAKEERVEIIVGESREDISPKERKKREKEKQKFEVQKRRLEDDLQKKISFADYLIKENKIELALKNLLEIQKSAEDLKNTSMVKKAEERIFLCKKLQLEMKEKEERKEEVKEAEKEIEKVEEKERSIEEVLQKRLDSVDDLIKEKKMKLAVQSLVEIQKEAQTHELKDLANSIEEKIISCKKSEVDTINRIKQTILTLGAKFSRLQLADISEKSGIEDEGLIESIILGMIRNKEIQGEYFSRSKALTLEVAAPVQVEEKAEGSNVFISYSTLDTDYFQVSKIVRRLELYPEINRVIFWEADSQQNIVEFMEETLRITNAFILFCSENSFKSGAVKGEWQSAYQMVKKGLMKMIPVYENEDHIPRLLWNMLNVKFTKDDFEGFIQKLYEEILR